VALFATDPALAADPEALKEAAGNGHEEFVLLMLRYQAVPCNPSQNSRSKVYWASIP